MNVRRSAVVVTDENASPRRPTKTRTFPNAPRSFASVQTRSSSCVVPVASGFAAVASASRIARITYDWHASSTQALLVDAIALNLTPLSALDGLDGNPRT